MSSVTRQGTAAKYVLTIVVEDYFQVGTFDHLIPSANWGRFETRLRRNTDAALELLDKTNNRATFFACGWIADNHPEILVDIVKSGHELACQGYFHYAINEISPQAFAKDLERSRHAIEDAIGSAVQGFRIGRGWFSSRDLWALDELARMGFAYDSSLCRIGRDFWSEPYRSAVHEHRGQNGSIYEVPPSTLSIGRWSVPISGGNYLRQFPDWLLRRGAQKWISQHSEPLVLYFHTWELDADQPRIAAANLVQRMRHYRNLAQMPEKIRQYLDRYQFTSISDHLNLGERERDKRENIPDLAVPITHGEAAGETKATPLTLIIPCFNEQEALPYLKKTLDRFSRKSAQVFDLSYILIDDGSTDDTWRLLQELFSNQPQTQVIKHESNKGIAAAIVTGFDLSQTDLVAVLDADCTFAPDQLLEMFSLLTDDVDVIAASPAHEKGALRNVPAWRKTLSLGSAFLYRCVLNHQLTSYTSCFRLYRKRAIKGMQVINHGFCGVTEILGRIDLAGFKIVEYPAVLEVRLLGHSKIKVLRTIFDHIKLITRLAALRWFGRAMPERITSDARNDEQ